MSARFFANSIAISAVLMCSSMPVVAATPPDLGSLSYRPIGPAIAGGRTTAVVGSDLDPLLYYAGGADGGVFKTMDGGFTWKPVFDNADVAAIGAIAIDPRDDDDVWVGTGESNPRNDVAGGDGIWRSRDGGKSWKHLGLPDAGSISSISIDPRDARRVVVGVLGQIFRDSMQRGVYNTADGGVHWTRTLYVGPSTGVSDLIRSPDRPDTLFAGMYELRRKPWTMISGGPSGGVFRSDDDGATWRRLSGDGLPSGDTGRIGLAAAANGRVYAIIQSASGDLWRSDDGGSRWRLMPHSSLVGDRRFYFSRIFVDPADANKLIDVGLILSMSTNGGRTFGKIATNDGWDYHQVWWSHDGRRVGVGSDEGIVMSADGGSTWHQPYDLPFAQAYHVGYDDAQPNYDVCIGLQDDSSWCGPANGDSGLGVLNRDWTTVGPGDGMWALYDPLDPHLIWSTSTSSDTGQVTVWDSRTRQAYEVSPDAEQDGLEPASALTHRFNWDSPIAFTSDGAVLVGGDAMFKSTDRGQHWAKISPDLTRNVRAHQRIPGGPIDADMSGAETADNILYIQPSWTEPNVIWAGTDDGLVWVTRDAGVHWTNVTPRGAPMWGRVAGMDAGRFGASAFVAFDDHMLGDDAPHLYATNDYGATWHSISGDLPSYVFARSIRQDIANPALLYAGTQRGMFASWDSGRHWRSLRLNMPATAIYDIELQPRADDLIVATHGRGVWILDDLRPLQVFATTGAVTLIAPRDAVRWYQWSPINSFDGLPTNEFVGPNRKYGATIDYVLGAGKPRSASIRILDASGRVVRHLSGSKVPHKAGLNRATWNLAEDGPVKWKGTFADNQGPDTGPEVVPGTFTVVLTVDGIERRQPLIVRADPRDTTTLALAQARHDALAELNREMSGIDTILNQIDKRLRSAPPAERSALIAFQRRLTRVPRNVEDLGGPPGLREKVSDLLGRIGGSSFQAPTAPQAAQAEVMRRAYAAMQSDYGKLR